MILRLLLLRQGRSIQRVVPATISELHSRPRRLHYNLVKPPIPVNILGVERHFVIRGTVLQGHHYAARQVIAVLASLAASVLGQLIHSRLRLLEIGALNVQPVGDGTPGRPRRGEASTLGSR